MPGLVVNVRNALPDRAELEALRPVAVRSIIYSVADVGKLLAVLPPGVALDLMVNNECQEVGWGWSGLEGALGMIARNYAGRVRLIEVGNELDSYWANDPNDVPPAFGADLVRRAVPILKPAGILTVMASVAGPRWPDWLGQAIAACSTLPDGVAAHFYGQRPDGWQRPGWGFGDLRPAIVRAYELAHRPVYLTELGAKVSDAGSEVEQANYLLAAAKTVEALGPAVCPALDVFAWRDDVGTLDERGLNGFGLRREDGSKRPAWDAFASLGHYEPPPPPDEEPALAAREAALRDLWSAATATPVKVAYNPESAFARWWRQHPEAGSPVGPEHADDEGTFQAFASAGVMEWLGGDQVGRAKVS
jgi:hypothetical protein